MAFVPQAISGAWLVMVLLLVAVVGGHTLAMNFHSGKPIGLILVLVMCLAKLMLVGALYRLALFGTKAREEGLGFGGLQAGWPELRLIVANIIIGLFTLVIIVAVFIVFAVAFETSGLGAGYANTREAVVAMVVRHATVADGLVIAYGVGTMIFLVFVALKFSLAHAATVVEHRIVTLNAMGLSSGNVGKLFIGVMAIGVPFAVVWLIVLHLFCPPGYLPLLPHPVATPGIRLGLHLVMLVLDITLLPPLLAGFFASAYRQITANRAK